MSKGLPDTYMYVLPTYRWPDTTVINTKCQQCFFLIKNTHCCGFNLKHSTMVYWQPSCWDVVLNVYWKRKICSNGSRSIDLVCRLLLEKKKQPQFSISQTTTIYSNHGSKFFYDNYYISKANIAIKISNSTVCMNL